MSASPRPWRVCPPASRPWSVPGSIRDFGPWKSPHDYLNVDVLSADDRGVVVDRDMHIPDEQAEANAALIVRTVNAHDDLLLAAKEAAVVIADAAKAAGADPIKGTCLPRLLAAIAKAEAGK